MESLIGTVVDEVAFDVERGKIAEFARATGSRDRVHTDRGEASRRGLADVAATATHVVVAGHHRSQAAMLEKLGLELRRVVVGSTSWQYERPLLAGDSVTGRRVVVGDEVKRTAAGDMRVVTLETEYCDGPGKVAVRQREVIIEKGR